MASGVENELHIQEALHQNDPWAAVVHGIEFEPDEACQGMEMPDRC
jgi:hypothetical protein